LTRDPRHPHEEDDFSYSFLFFRLIDPIFFLGGSWVGAQDEERRRQRRRLGRTAAGRWVNLGYWRSLVDMGFDEERAARALRRTDNDLGRSVDALNAAAGQTDADDDDDADVLARVVSLGFPVRLARGAVLNLELI